RQRQVARTVREGLAGLRRLAGANRSEEFFAAIFRLLQEQLGERLDLPASAITEAIVDERLRPRGAPAETLVALQELFQACNQARLPRPQQPTKKLSPAVACPLPFTSTSAMRCSNRAGSAAPLQIIASPNNSRRATRTFARTCDLPATTSTALKRACRPGGGV